MNIVCTARARLRRIFCTSGLARYAREAAMHALAHVHSRESRVVAESGLVEDHVLRLLRVHVSQTAATSAYERRWEITTSVRSEHEELVNESTRRDAHSIRNWEENLMMT